MSQSATAGPKRSHADSRREPRLNKARRIEALLRLVSPDLESKDLLDVGTGSGIIASYFAQRVGSLQSVDVIDERVEIDFAFDLIDSEQLPYEGARFDIAISNHVIEHVDDPRLHLAEIARVLRPGGYCYLATPNLLWPIEPHFRLPFLAWLPTQELRNSYVTLLRRGVRYDARLLTHGELVKLADHAGLQHQDMSLQLTTLVFKTRFGIDAAALRHFWPAARLIMPSLVTVLSKS